MSYTVDLTPAEFRSVKTLKRAARLWVALCAAVLAVVLGLAGTLHVQAVRLDKRMAPMRERIAGMQDREARLALIARDLREVRESQTLVKRLCHEPFWCGLLADLAAATSDRVRIAELRIAEGSAEGNGEADSEHSSTITITGKASSDIEVIELISTLSDSEHLASLNLKRTWASSEADARNRVEFELHGTVK